MQLEQLVAFARGWSRHPELGVMVTVIVAAFGIGRLVWVVRRVPFIVHAAAGLCLAIGYAITRLPVTEGAARVNPFLVVLIPAALAYGLYGAFAKPAAVPGRHTS